MAEAIATFAILGLFLTALLFGTKFMLKRSHDGIDASIEMQKSAIKAQDDAIRMGAETLEIQRKILAEIKRLNENLEKR